MSVIQFNPARRGIEMQNASIDALDLLVVEEIVRQQQWHVLRCHFGGRNEFAKRRAVIGGGIFMTDHDDSTDKAEFPQCSTSGRARRAATTTTKSRWSSTTLFSMDIMQVGSRQYHHIVTARLL
ncbi:MAG: hypothetical protein ACRYG5_01480 [Janthinobacterium lividum]